MGTWLKPPSARLPSCGQIMPKPGLSWAKPASRPPRLHASKYTGLADLQQALRLDPASVSANLLMGLYWSRQGEPLKADRLYPQHPGA